MKDSVRKLSKQLSGFKTRLNKIIQSIFDGIRKDAEFEEPDTTTPTSILEQESEEK